MPEGTKRTGTKQKARERPKGSRFYLLPFFVSGASWGRTCFILLDRRARQAKTRTLAEVVRCNPSHEQISTNRSDELTVDFGTRVSFGELPGTPMRAIFRFRLQGFANQPRHTCTSPRPIPRGSIKVQIWFNRITSGPPPRIRSPLKSNDHCGTYPGRDTRCSARATLWQNLGSRRSRVESCERSRETSARCSLWLLPPTSCFCLDTSTLAYQRKLSLRAAHQFRPVPKALRPKKQKAKAP